MITTVTLNAAIDKTYFLPRFIMGEVNRVKQTHVYPGGKGINVARVIHLLGYDSLATGFIGGGSGDYIERELSNQGISHQFIRIQGESRTCLNIIDAFTGNTTEILEPGPEISAEQVDLMMDNIRRLARKSAIIAFSGSIPAGAPASIYAQMITAAKQEGTRVLLDASGEALRLGIEAEPYFIKPNREEMQQLLKKPIVEEDLYEGLLELNRKGIACAAVSLGEYGAAAAYNGEIYRIKTPQIEAVNTVGCGDSFVAGMAIALSKGDPIMECLRYAAAVGSANALTAEAGNVRKADVARMMKNVKIIMHG
ncbi:MAG TPA: 1-phosphofructokinase [Bacilli bacterium]